MKLIECLKEWLYYVIFYVIFYFIFLIDLGGLKLYSESVINCELDDKISC